MSPIISVEVAVVAGLQMTLQGQQRVNAAWMTSVLLRINLLNEEEIGL